MRARYVADLLICAGIAFVALGLALIYPPAALIAGGIGLALFGALAIEVKP